jgi:hypothetical protein
MNPTRNPSVDSPAPADPPPRQPGARRRLWGLGQRRRFIVDRRQLRTTILVTAGVAVVLAVLLMSLHFSRERTTEAIVTQLPSLAETLEAQNRIDFTFQLASAFVFLCMVAVVTLLETHKTAGAAFNLRRQMRKIRDGEYGTRVTLRRGDNLQSLGHAFNEMSIALDERLWQDIEVLDCLGHRLQQISDREDARQLAETLHGHVATRRRTAGFPEDDGHAPAEVPVHDQVPATVSSD